MNLRTLLGPLVAAVLVVAGTTAEARAASNKELEARADELASRLGTIERSAGNLVPMQQQIEAARAELRTLRGQIEEARHELGTLRQQQRDLYADLDRRLLLLENNTVPATPGASPASAENDLRAADETSVYGDAFAALKAGRYGDAARGFELYLAKYPDGPRADNATYWLGEAHYVQKDYTSALRAFQHVLERFPDSAKAADAMLKAGFCQYELKAFRNARTTLENVVAGYPGTDADRLARERLARMDVERR